MICQAEVPKDKTRSIDFGTADDMNDGLGCARATMLWRLASRVFGTSCVVGL